MGDDNIRHYAESEEPVDEFIDSSYHPSGLWELTRNFCLDKAWSLLQYGLYPDFETDLTHPLAKAIVKAHRFPNTNMDASYLYSDEVAQVWQHIKEVKAQTIIDNLSANRKHQKFDDLTADINYALYNFSHLLSAFYCAFSYKEGLIFHYG